jgi:hypothetical protein
MNTAEKRVEIVVEFETARAPEDLSATVIRLELFRISYENLRLTRGSSSLWRLGYVREHFVVL